MLSLRNRLKFGALAVLVLAGAHGASAKEVQTDLFKVITVKDEIVIELTTN